MTASVEFGHKWSLHQDGVPAAMGFGYPNALDCPTRDEVVSRAQEWNSMKAEDCPHGSYLKGAKCGLCGNHYNVTDL